MNVRHFETPVHGRVLVGQRDPSRVVVGFHGYGETAERHLAELETLDGEWTLVAVQALHPFYTRSGEVVASWMTSVDRELAITDNLEYVRRVVSSFAPFDRLVFCGFSQGAAMAYRAASSHLGVCDGVLILGGDLPPDVQITPAFPRLLIGRGERDEWFTGEKLKKDLSYLTGAGVRFEVCEFDGGHEWSAEFRTAASEFLREIG